MNKPTTCDIFCNVIDNYGDVGVCWRLARLLAQEHGIAVRLWVDDLASLQRLCPEVNTGLVQQICREVKVRHWTVEAFESRPMPQPVSNKWTWGIADLVIETFACELPESYVAQMAERERKPVWINLEYLSAEKWVEGCHKLPSPHTTLHLTKSFFFPGFTLKTGGLLLERDLLERRDAFQHDATAINRFWKSLGLPAAEPEELRVSLFCYETPALPALLNDWATGDIPVLCLVPEGPVLAQLAEYFGKASFGRPEQNPARVFDKPGTNSAAAGDVFVRGNLDVRVLPFVEQERYDELLWACDVNFVRGEDSFVRAQWAGKPFVWHIYPQHDGAHLQKLRAFIEVYGTGLKPAAREIMQKLWLAWNGDGAMTEAIWEKFCRHRIELGGHTLAWAERQSKNNQALNLLDFFREVGRIPAFEIKAGG